MLTCVLLTNLYRGSLTSDLTAPIPTAKLERVQQAVDNDFQILVPAAGNQSRIDQRANLDKEILANSTRLKQWAIEHLTFSHNFIAALISSETQRNISNNFNFKALVNSLDIQLYTNDSVERRLSECNKTIYVGTTEELKQMQESIQRKGISKYFYRGDDRFLSHPLAWVFSRMSFDRLNFVQKGFQAVIHSGIFDYFHRTYDGQYQTAQDSDVRSLSTESGFFVSTLVIYATLFAFSLSALICEILIFNFYMAFKNTFAGRSKACAPNIILVSSA
jgi:hypothetical protein